MKTKCINFHNPCRTDQGEETGLLSPGDFGFEPDRGDCLEEPEFEIPGFRISLSSESGVAEGKAP